MSSEKMICFTDSRGNPLFSLPDSSFLRLEYDNGISPALSAAITVRNRWK